MGKESIEGKAEASPGEEKYLPRHANGNGYVPRFRGRTSNKVAMNKRQEPKEEICVKASVPVAEKRDSLEVGGEPRKKEGHDRG